MPTSMIEAMEEKGQYVACGGDKERPWAFLRKEDEETPEWATAEGKWKQQRWRIQRTDVHAEHNTDPHFCGKRWWIYMVD